MTVTNVAEALPLRVRLRRTQRHTPVLRVSTAQRRSLRRQTRSGGTIRCEWSDPRSRPARRARARRKRFRGPTGTRARSPAGGLLVGLAALLRVVGLFDPITTPVTLAWIVFAATALLVFQFLQCRFDVKLALAGTGLFVALELDCCSPRPAAIPVAVRETLVPLERWNRRW